jgi:excisionase family DNA binding protein
VLGDLVAIGDRLMARSGQQRPNVAVDGPGGDGGGVTPLLVGYRDAAAVLGVGERTVRRLVADGTLPSMRVGQRVLVHVDDLAAYAASLRHDWRADIVTKGPLDAENSPRRHRSVVVRRRAG